MEQCALKKVSESTALVTVANHNSHRQPNKPTTTRNKYMLPAPSAGKRVQTSHIWFYFRLVEKKVARDFLAKHKTWNAKPKQS